MQLKSLCGRRVLAGRLVGASVLSAIGWLHGPLLQLHLFCHTNATHRPQVHAGVPYSTMTIALTASKESATRVALMSIKNNRIQSSKTSVFETPLPLALSEKTLKTQKKTKN